MAGRNRQDASLNRSIALPAAGASASTTAIDFGAFAGIGSIRPEEVNLIFGVPATPSLTEAKVITLTLEDSADNSSFTAIASAAARTVTGAALAAGGAAFEDKVPLPYDARQYIRLTAAVESGGGSNIAVSFYLKPVF
jgi:hypothetical protein